MNSDAPGGGGGQSGAGDAGHAAFQGGDGGQGGGQPGGGQPSGDQGGQPDGGQPAGGAPAAQPSLSAKDIAEAIKQAGLGAPAAAQPPKTYSQEDYDRAFNTWQPGEDVVKLLLAGGPDAVKALMSMRDGIAKQAVTMASYLAAQVREQLEEKYAPVQTFYQEQQVRQLYDEFYKEFEDLKPYDSLVRAVVDQMKASNVKLGSKDEAFKELSKRVREVMKTIPGLNGNAGGAPAGGQSSSGTGKGMPTLSSGGQSSSRGGQQGAAKSPGHAVFS